MSLVTAVVLMEVERGKVDTVAQDLLKYDGVSEVFSVAGQYDLVALLRTKTNEQIADLVTDKIRNLPFITRTQTLMAFKAFSRVDLDRMFSIGNEQT
ncbi:MAG: Lrp/AsnC ligand binding domain-containing protein [Anaerolineae bacterium]|nr:Lrp/AsnC ligand binding domain-containing protein [Anaerolineae bacterium]